MHLLPYDYYADRPQENIGLALTAELIETARAEVANSMLLDNGDLLQGNPMADYLSTHGDFGATHPHPMIAAMNLLRYDAATPGNHDFNYGLAFLKQAMAGADFPFVLSNVITGRGPSPVEDTFLAKPYVILRRPVILGDGTTEHVNIGVIGFVPPQITVWDFRNLVGRVLTRDILDSARTWVPEMRAAGADIVIALCHSGIGSGAPAMGMENAAAALAEIDGIDVILTGHEHLLFPGADIAPGRNIDPAAGTLSGKPAVMAGFWGSHLGVIDLMLERTETGWSQVASRSELRPVADSASRNNAATAMRREIETATARVHRETLAYIRRPVGETLVDLNSFFAQVSNSTAVALVAEAQRWYMQARLSGTRHSNLPLLSAAAPFKAGGRAGAGFYTDVEKGKLTIRSIADLYLYPNTIHALQVRGAELRDWLEHAAGQFLQITPGLADQPLLDPAFPSYNFDVIDGLHYRIDPTGPARFDPHGTLVNPDAWRIRDLRHFGKTVEDDDLFIVATNSYRASGGGGFAGAQVSNTVYEAPDMVRDVLLQYIADRGGVRDLTLGTWSLPPLPNTSAIFESAPAGATRIPALPHGRIDHLGPGTAGFDRYRLSF